MIHKDPLIVIYENLIRDLYASSLIEDIDLRVSKGNTRYLCMDFFVADNRGILARLFGPPAYPELGVICFFPSKNILYSASMNAAVKDFIFKLSEKYPEFTFKEIVDEY